jgi:TATA-box binding protein (TBP) (component of TFIID and TFIIIB)
MQKQKIKSKLSIVNVVATANLNQKISIEKFVKFGWGIYDLAVYGGRCGYVKTPDMDGRVTVFQSGKMISIGGKSIKKSIQQLNEAKFYLVKEKFVQNIVLHPKIQNIVATITLSEPLSIAKTYDKLTGAIYEPEQFPGIILKSVNSVNYLIFASGKIIITGAKTKTELTSAALELKQKLGIET